MTKSELFLQNVLTYIDTPFADNGRQPGTEKGCFLDCAGVVVCGLQDIGVPHSEPFYRLTTGHDHYENMVAALAMVFDRVPDDERQPGDVAAFRWPKMPNHLAVFVTEKKIIHAVPGRGVCETPFGYDVEARLRSCWRLPEVNKLQSGVS